MFCLESELLELFKKFEIKGLKCGSIPKGNFVALEGSNLQLIIDYAKNNKILKEKRPHKILLIGTGSLHNPFFVNQKLTIPSIAHAVSLEVA